MSRISKAPRANFPDPDLQKYVKKTAQDLNELYTNKASASDLAAAQGDIATVQGDIATAQSQIQDLQAALALLDLKGFFINGEFANTADPADFTLIPATTIDFRDRYVEVRGDVTIYQATTNFLPGGADDNELEDLDNNINGVAIKGLFNGWMYTRSGGASRTTKPYIYAVWDGTNEKAYIWVDTSGNLKLGIDTSRGSSFRNVTFNLRIIYSDDQGAY